MDSIIIGIILGLFGLIQMLIILKIGTNKAKNIAFEIVDELKSELKGDAEAWLNSETGQKALFSIGAMVANGGKAGLGLQKTGGKKGLEGLIIDIGGEFIRSQIAQRTGIDPKRLEQAVERQGLNSA